MRASHTLLNLVMIRSADVSRSARFYMALGIPLKQERHGHGPDHWSGESNGVVLELYPQGDATIEPATVRLGFRVASVAAAMEAALANGGSLLSAARMSDWGLRAVVTDPDGYRVELLEAAGVTGALPAEPS